MIRYQTLQTAASTRTAWILHGILGSGRNWRSFARTLMSKDPTWRYVLPDLRNHGQTGPLPGPHDLDACVRDLSELPSPDRVIGHSFGGKVALQWAATVGTAEDVWVLDSIPVAADPSSDNEVMTVLGALSRVQTPAAERADVRDTLTQAGLSKMLVDWLLTSLKRTPEGWVWLYGLEGIAQMMQAYFTTDFGAWLATNDQHPVNLVRAMRSDRWTPEILSRITLGPAVKMHELHDAGHWLHVDNPEGLRRLLIPG